jgi:hypothetical protein
MDISYCSESRWLERSNDCLIELLNVSELEFTCCVLEIEGQWKGYRWKEWREAMTTM